MLVVVLRLALAYIDANSFRISILAEMKSISDKIVELKSKRLKGQKSFFSANGTNTLNFYCNGTSTTSNATSKNMKQSTMDFYPLILV